MCKLLVLSQMHIFLVSVESCSCSQVTKQIKMWVYHIAKFMHIFHLRLEVEIILSDQTRHPPDTEWNFISTQVWVVLISHGIKHKVQIGNLSVNDHVVTECQ